MRYVVAMLLYLAKYSTYKCQVWALTNSADTATHIPTFRASAYQVTGSYGGKILDSFSIKLLTDLPTALKLRHWSYSGQH